MLGLEAKEVLGALLVPIAIGLLGVVVPWAQERRKRTNFEELARRELQEAKPRGSARSGEQSWHMMMSKRFLHEAVISNPADTCDFVLSLNPDLSYYLGQMWMSFHKAETVDGAEDGRMYADEWCHFLHSACVELDRLGRYRISRIVGRRVRLVDEVWRPWHEELDRMYAAHTCETVPGTDTGSPRAVRLR
jgi:hypothetical protein